MKSLLCISISTASNRTRTLAHTHTYKSRDDNFRNTLDFSQYIKRPHREKCLCFEHTHRHRDTCSTTSDTNECMCSVCTYIDGRIILFGKKGWDFFLNTY